MKVPEGNFPVGSKVRSYDFESSREHYIEGEVLGIHNAVDCAHYAIKVEKVVWDGKEEPESKKIGSVVRPPVNGVPTFMGSVTKGVEKI